MSRDVWVLPELPAEPEEVSKKSLSLLTEARLAAEKLGGSLTVLVPGGEIGLHQALLRDYGARRVVALKHHLLEKPLAPYYARALNALKGDKPYLFILGHTPLGRELASLISCEWGCGLAANCVKIDFAENGPRFYRGVLNGQAYAEVVFGNDLTRIVTLNPAVLNILAKPAAAPPVVEVIEPDLQPDSRIIQRGYLPADYQTVDLEEARVVVGAGAGSLSPDILSLVKELAELIEGSLGGTRPAVDEGKIEQERLIGQTGKIISPELYLALGVSGASQHVGGIQEAGTIVAVNRDPRAEIFKVADKGAASDLKEVLPLLIEKIKRARKDGKIV